MGKTEGEGRLTANQPVTQWYTRSEDGWSAAMSERQRGKIGEIGIPGPGLTDGNIQGVLSSRDI